MQHPWFLEDLPDQILGMNEARDRASQEEIDRAFDLQSQEEISDLVDRAHQRNS